MTTDTKTDAKAAAPVPTGLLTFRTVDAEYPKSAAILERTDIVTEAEFGPCAIAPVQTGGYPNTRMMRIHIEARDAAIFVALGRNPDATSEPRLRIEPGKANAYECDAPRTFKLSATLAV